MTTEFSSRDPHQSADRHDPVYDELHASPEFAELKRRYRGFVFPATIAFLAWYLLYVVLSNWAGGFMSTKVIGDHINVALVFGLLQFATTFLIAWLYSNYSTKRLDPLARELDERFIALEGKSSRGRGNH
ncbi:DUF485 domain-containing protein [Nocardioides albidus]|uniref:DUF485 domain-containing protein n=1 Tax=Nocardioides albidus TaxID=1517589 RepID=A0A5C4VRZ5_9ACTN|nr:DUF485 domain-containing protein [Nocardioides albidus]TNM38607.1 DUF485 domain-containing protein [Nocardioides albidus]